jgi:Transposase DNA-binding
MTPVSKPTRHQVLAVANAIPGPVAVRNRHRLAFPCTPRRHHHTARLFRDAPRAQRTALGGIVDPAAATDPTASSWVPPGLPAVLEDTTGLPRSLTTRQEIRRWAQLHFAQCRLSRSTQRRRAVTIAAAWASHPGASLPELFPTPYDLQAAYRMFDEPEATPDNLQRGHRQVVATRLHRPGEYLLIEDTSTISFRNRRPISGLGPVDRQTDRQMGFLLHSVLAVAWPQVAEAEAPIRRPPVVVVGLADPQFEVRTPRPVGTPPPRSQRPNVWVRASHRLGPAPARPTVRWVRVADREADIYEYLCSCRQLHHGFVIRATQDRVVWTGAGSATRQRLMAAAREVAPLASLELEVRRRGSVPARTAQLRVGARPLQLARSSKLRASSGLPGALTVTAVRVWEVAAPAGVTPLEWILLCDQPVTTPTQAVERVLQYASRWLIEEFHKGLKTGLRAERLQLGEGQRLIAAVAIMSVVALRLLDLRERVRLFPEAAAEESGLSRCELEVLSRAVGRPVPTVRAVGLAVGRLGGHLNRKSDGLPGWQTLSHGMTKLGLLVQGYRLALGISENDHE